MASILKVDQIQESTTGVGTNFSNTGSASNPTISIGNQTNKGFYHEGTNKIGVSVGGSKVGEIGAGYGGFTGNVIQIVQGFSTTRYSITSNTNWGQASDGITLTPKYVNSKILFSFAFTGQFNTSPGYPSLSVARKIGNGAIVYNLEGSTYGLLSPGTNNVIFNAMYLNYVDTLSLSSIDTVTYYLCSRLTASGGTFSLNAFSGGQEKNVLVLMEIQS